MSLSDLDWGHQWSCLRYPSLDPHRWCAALL